MSNRVMTSTSAALLSIQDGPVPQLRRSEQKTKRFVAIAALAAAVLAANNAAAASKHPRRYGAPTPNSSWVGHFTPHDYGRYDHGVSTWSGVTPGSGHGAFEDTNSAP